MTNNELDLRPLPYEELESIKRNERRSAILLGLLFVVMIVLASIYEFSRLAV